MRAQLDEWTRIYPYTGERGHVGYVTDQIILCKRLREWAVETQRAWVLDDAFTRYRRLDRNTLDVRAGFTRRELFFARRGWYTDYHSPPPATHGALNEAIFERALAAHR